jgi:hypothetical protein
MKHGDFTIFIRGSGSGSEARRARGAPQSGGPGVALSRSASAASGLEGYKLEALRRERLPTRVSVRLARAAVDYDKALVAGH